MDHTDACVSENTGSVAVHDFTGACMCCSTPLIEKFESVCFYVDICLMVCINLLVGAYIHVGIRGSMFMYGVFVQVIIDIALHDLFSKVNLFLSICCHFFTCSFFNFDDVYGVLIRQTIWDMLQRPINDFESPDALIIETSGVTNPSALIAMLEKRCGVIK